MKDGYVANVGERIEVRVQSVKKLMHWTGRYNRVQYVYEIIDVDGNIFI